jgi:hypothetical protein
VQQFPSGDSNWTVFGGTGRFAGATGSGTTKDISNRGDGVAWTNETKGTIKTK